MNSTPLTSTEGVHMLESLRSAQDVVDRVASWAPAKLYSSTVPKASDHPSATGVHPSASSIHLSTTTYTGEFNDDFWAARITELPEAYWPYLLDYIVGSVLAGPSHTHYEKEYIHELYDFKLYDIDLGFVPEGYSGSAYLAKLYYTFGFPLQKRKFNELIQVLRANDDTHAFVISLAVDPALMDEDSESYVTGRYTSIEKIERVDNKIKWTMATCSDPGGYIPKFVTRASIKGAIAKDVPSFLSWATKKGPITK